MLYALYVTILISGELHESKWKTFTRFEECWEVATTIVHNRPNMTARCVLEETKPSK